MGHPAPDSNGCNWYISHLTNAGDHMMDVSAALASVKKRWNLAG
jgi:glycine cleavage system regulatory protein